MPVRDILRLGDPRLRRRCDPVADPSAPAAAATIVDLRDTLEHWRAGTGYGRAIAAPQRDTNGNGADQTRQPREHGNDARQ